jgi:hypothetical protein
MACEKQRALVEKLDREHKEAQADCHDGIKSACVRARKLANELVNARHALENCLHPPQPTKPPVPVPLTLTLTKFVCRDESDPGPFENDEPYAVVFAVDLKVVGPIPTGAINNKMTLVGPLDDVSEGDTVLAPANVIWGLSNARDFVSSADNLVVIAVMMENDSGNPDQVRTVLEKAAQVGLGTNAGLFASGAIPRQELVNRIIADVTGAIPVAKVGVPDPDDNIGPPKELRFFQSELDNIYRNLGGGAIEKSLDFAGDDAEYTLVFKMFR